MKAVPDTNVLVSALFNSSTPPSLIVDAWRAARFEIVLSPGLLAELDEVFDRGEIAPYVRLATRWVDEFRRQLRGQTSIVEPVEVVVVKDDPDDDLVVGTAIAGEADVIITGDKHLLAIGPYRGIQILTPRQFLDVLELEERRR